MKVLTKQEKIDQFDPNAPGNEELGIYGLPFTVEESNIVLIEVPWAVTVSSGGGAEGGPKRIIDRSLMVDLYNLTHPELWKQGIAVVEAPNHLVQNGKSLRKYAQKHIAAMARGKQDLASVMIVNKGCEKMVKYVEQTAAKYLAQGKTVGLIGGDHSTPLGLINEICKKHPGEPMGILHIDAHFDLRKAFEDFVYSHASIMWNALMQNKNLRLVSVGIRDFCQEEYDFCKNSNGRVKVFFDEEISERMYAGQSWRKIVDEIIAVLPNLVYISFDIDGLRRMYAPETGTPVPGGLEYQAALYLIKQVAKKRTIIGFDLNEVGNADWDGFVGAKLLLEMMARVMMQK